MKRKRPPTFKTVQRSNPTQVSLLWPKRPVANNVLGFLAPSWIQFSINLWVVPWIGFNPRPEPEAPDCGFEEAQQFY
jgi:hypothetical protein